MTTRYRTCEHIPHSAYGIRAEAIALAVVMAPDIPSGREGTAGARRGRRYPLRPWRPRPKCGMSWAMIRIALFSGLVAAALAGCGPDRARASPGEVVDRLAGRLREYVYATYDLQIGGDEAARAAALARLKEARVALADGMVRAGLGTPGEKEGLAALVPGLATFFAQRSDLVFAPAREGVMLVRADERREVRDRPLGTRAISYRIVVFREVAIEDLDRYRARGGPPAGSIASVSGTTIFLDAGLARRIAREVVLPWADAPPRPGATLAGVKDFVRFRALEREIAAGEDAVAAALLCEEETRLAALLASSAAAAGPVVPDPEKAAIEREAILAAALAGSPLYQAASAIVAALAGAPGATDALAALAGVPPGGELASALAAASPDAMRMRARAALGPGAR